MPELYQAYAEYLERMLQQSNNLVSVDITTVPEDQDLTPVMWEWADFD